jgi:hemerythrin-like domain-containing protein
LDQPLDHLLACHRRILDRLDVLERACAALAEKPEEAQSTIAKCLRFLESNGAWHTQDEERSLFPRLTGRLTSEEQTYLAELQRQHEQVEALFSRVRSAPLEGLPRLVPGLAEAYRAHIDFEERHLIGIARRLLSGEDLAAIAAEMKTRRGLG